MYSQSSEEQVILDYFKGYKGTFLDCGSNDGVTLSNTRALALLGWNGVLIEPSPEAFLRLQRTYKDQGMYLFNLALGKENGYVTLHESGEHLNQGDVSLVSTINESEKKRFEKSTEYHEIEVDCMRWDRFIDICPIKHFDCISIDIEGSELDVLPLMDISQTRLICIEWNSKESLRFEYEKYLNGFKLIHTTPENLIYGR